MHNIDSYNMLFCLTRRGLLSTVVVRSFGLKGALEPYKSRAGLINGTIISLTSYTPKS